MDASLVVLLLLMGTIGTLVVLSYLVRQGVILLRMKGEIKNLPTSGLPSGTSADSDIFSGASEFDELGNRFVAAFRRADANRVLNQFDVEKQMVPFALRLRTVGASTRGIAGFLILIALVTTLLNLYGAVSGLGATFLDLADSARLQAEQTLSPTEGTKATGGKTGDGNKQAPNSLPPVKSTPPKIDPLSVVDRVQRTMGNVAERAATAFLLSGVSVGGALVLLVAALGVQRQAHLVLRSFAAWAHGAYAGRIAETGRLSAADQRVDFSDAVRHFRVLVESFGKLSGELSNLGDFRKELNTAVGAITAAVDKLPAAIEANMASLSSTVTREIAEDLKHQYEILKSLLVAYGDLGLNMKGIETYIARVTQLHSEAAAALIKLGTLPEDTRNLAVTVVELNSKTEALRGMDLQSAQVVLADVRSHITQLTSSLQEFRERTQSKQDGLETILRDLDRRFQELTLQDADLQKTNLANTRTELEELKSRLERLNFAVHRADHGREIEGMIRQLKELHNRSFWSYRFSWGVRSLLSPLRGGKRGPSAK